MTTRKKVLNVGGNSKAIPLPPFYAEFEHLLLDIDASTRPDIIGDARLLGSQQPAEQFDAVYCAHNLEHYHRHEVAGVLAGFLHVLKPEGFAHIVVPDIQEAMRRVFAQGLDLEDVLYQSPAGPVTALDMIYGYGPQIERSGQDFFAHKTAFSLKSLSAALLKEGFSNVYGANGQLAISMLAFRQPPDPAVRTWLGLPAEG